MLYKLRAGRRKASVPSRSTEPELQPQLDTPALQAEDPDDIEAPNPARPQGPQTTSVDEEAEAASAPGSEYWLP